MARPVKKGLDYFPCDVNFTSSRIARRLKRKYGNDGIVVYITLLCDIYTNGYFIEVTDDYLFDLADSCSMNEKELSGVIESMVGMQLFDAALYEEKRVLTSQSIQECYLLAKRKSHPDQFIKDDLCLVSAAETGVIAAETGVIAAETGVIAAETGVNVSIMPQRKEKENKSKETTLNLKNNKEINNLNLTLPPARACARENFSFEAFHEMLEQDEDWQHSVVQASGKGVGILRLLPQIMPLFDAHIVSVGETGLSLCTRTATGIGHQAAPSLDHRQ